MPANAGDRTRAGRLPASSGRLGFVQAPPYRITNAFLPYASGPPVTFARSSSSSSCMNGKKLDWPLTVVVGAHLLITIVHAIAHQGAQVLLTRAATVFVLIVIVIGPMAGVAVSTRWQRAGGWIVTATMAGALVFGFVNHFVMASPDHVSHVAAPWQPLFATTAWLLMLTEADCVVVGVRLATFRHVVV